MRCHLRSIFIRLFLSNSYRVHFKISEIKYLLYSPKICQSSTFIENTIRALSSPDLLSRIIRIGDRYIKINCSRAVVVRWMILLPNGQVSLVVDGIFHVPFNNLFFCITTFLPRIKSKFDIFFHIVNLYQCFCESYNSNGRLVKTQW